MFDNNSTNMDELHMERMHHLKSSQKMKIVLLLFHSPAYLVRRPWRKENLVPQHNSAWSATKLTLQYNTILLYYHDKPHINSTEYYGPW